MRRRRRFTVAAVQMTSTTDVPRNLARAGREIRRAAQAGAALIALPENFAYLRSEGRRIAYRQSLRGELARWGAEQARRARAHLLLGSIPLRIPGSEQVYNTSLLFDPSGRRIASYRKIHLFDVRIRGGAVFSESKTVRPGRRRVVVDTPLGRLGLSICYDLRFPELYRHLTLSGAQVLMVPSAFTAYTGRAHWMELLRARAIENLCWVVAPAQVGRHSPTRQSHGHTAVVDPWGRVVAIKRRGTGVVTAELDLGEVDRVRAGLPALRHVRPGLLGRSSSRVRGL